MSDEAGSQLISVKTELVLQELVENLAVEAEARAGDMLEPEVEEGLQAAPTVLAATELVDQEARAALVRLARAGWHARLREIERFQAAAAPPTAGLSEALRAGDWPAAVSTCADLAAQEPLKRAAPADPAAVSWQVSGPGGHVRHYVALRAIGSSSDAVEAARSLGHDDPTPLKRVWLFGFLLAEAVRERAGAQATGLHLEDE